MRPETCELRPLKGADQSKIWVKFVAVRRRCAAHPLPMLEIRMKTLRTLLLICVVAGAAACGSDTSLVQPESGARFDSQASDTASTKTERGGGFVGSGG
jgi:hypothetical protein